jgi:hypothetical protein
MSGIVGLFNRRIWRNDEECARGTMLSFTMMARGRDVNSSTQSQISTFTQLHNPKPNHPLEAMVQF